MATTPNVTRAQVTASAPVTVTLPTGTLTATPRTFSTGSVGYQANGKVVIMIDGTPVQCQVGVTITVIGSKTLPGAA